MGNKKITICASNAFITEAEKWKRQLEEKGYEIIKIPVVLNSNYEEIHKLHYAKIVESDIVFILNLKKNGVENYIGPSVFAEIAFTIGLNLVLDKKIEIFCLNEIPDNLSYSEELLLWRELGWIKKW